MLNSTKAKTAVTKKQLSVKKLGKHVWFLKFNFG